MHFLRILGNLNTKYTFRGNSYLSKYYAESSQDLILVGYVRISWSIPPYFLFSYDGSKFSTTVLYGINRI